MAMFYQRGYAQTQKVLADKIIAKIGDKIILSSDITNAIADYKRQGQEASLPVNAPCVFLDGQLTQKLLILQAERDSLQVNDDEIESALDNKIRYFVQTYGSKEILEQVAGKTVFQIKEDFRQAFKENKLAELMRNKILENVHVTPLEVEIYFNKIPKDSLPYYESVLEISKISIYDKANKDVEAYIKTELEGFRNQVLSGTQKFDQLARLYSQDPGSKDNGGQYTVNRSDKFWDPAFFAAIFKLKEGQISPVIKSKFGYHIIQLVSRSGDEFVIRHILLIPPISKEDIAVSIARLDSIRNIIVKNHIPFNNAVSLFTEDESSKFNGGAETAPDGSIYLNYDDLSKEEVSVIRGMQVGDISKSFPFTDERGKQGVSIIYLKYRTEPHRANLRDDFDKMAQLTLAEKKQNVLIKWFNKHIHDFYVSIDKSYSNCSSVGMMKEWEQVSVPMN